MRIASSYAGTDPGKKRRRNEDSYVIAPPLFAVADGMGGAQAGEVASGLAAGALEESEYTSKLRTAGFTDVEVEPWRIYHLEDARAFLTESGLDVDALAPQVKDTFASAFVRATKPVTSAARACCAPGCCA